MSSPLRNRYYYDYFEVIHWSLTHIFTTLQVIQAITDANGSDEIPSQDTYIAIPKAVADGIYAASLSCLLLKK